MTEMTQREAVARAWSCAEVAHESLCALGDTKKADAYGRLAQVWAAVAAQLPFELDAEACPQPIAPPVGGEVLLPRPLDRREPTNALSPAELSREQAAADAALRGEPVDDPRDTVVMSTVATPAGPPAAYELPLPMDRATCRCGLVIVWRGGGWVHEHNGELHCVAR